MSPHILNIPLDIRQHIYALLTTSSFLIEISVFDITTTLSPITSLLRTHSTFYHEITAYLAPKPIVLYCSRGYRPTNILRIPRPIYKLASVVVIEDSPIAALEFGLLPNLKCICFVERWVTTLSVMSVVGCSPARVPSREDALTVPSGNGECLKVAHEFWKRLRIENSWIRELWKERKEGRGVRVVLRRVMEVEVQLDGGQGDQNVVYAWHSVVDVDTKRLMQKGFLPRRRRAEEVVYDYGEARWWRT